MEKYGKITAPGTLVFERLLPGPVEKVWAYLTESEKRGKWLAKGEMELFEGGKVTLEFLHSDLSPDTNDPIPEKYKSMEHGASSTGTVLKISPPHLLAFTWESNSDVTFELKEQGDKVLLRLTHRNLVGSKDIRVETASGWHTHLGVLVANLEATTPAGFWKTHMQLEQEYEQMLS
jgi:uncharacterized protein YndB with AHSA1/START domain